MRIIRYTAALLCVALSLSACGAGGDESSALPEPSRLESVIEQSAVPDTAPEPLPEESPEQEEASETEEPAPAAPYQPAEWSDFQQDPTLIDPVYLPWDHIEYRVFGGPDSYTEHQKTFHEVGYDGRSLGGEEITVAYCLPEGTFDDSVLQVDLGFAGGPIKFGELPPLFYTLREEDPYAIKGEGHLFLRGDLGREGDPGNVVGGILEGENFIRDITLTSHKNHQVRYIVRLDESRLAILYFYVSAKATREELALYDAVAESMHIVP